MGGGSSTADVYARMPGHGRKAGKGAVELARAAFSCVSNHTQAD
jgi:hypothetical protein